MNDKLKPRTRYIKQNLGKNGRILKSSEVVNLGSIAFGFLVGIVIGLVIMYMGSK